MKPLEILITATGIFLADPYEQAIRQETPFVSSACYENPKCLDIKQDLPNKEEQLIMFDCYTTKDGKTIIKDNGVCSIILKSNP
jgi:hypothetical protein